MAHMGRGFEPHRRHCVVSLSKNIYPSLVLVLPRKTRPFITERLLMGRKESNQTNKQNHGSYDIQKSLPHHEKQACMESVMPCNIFLINNEKNMLDKNNVNTDIVNFSKLLGHIAFGSFCLPIMLTNAKQSWIVVHFNLMFDLKIKVGHYDLYFRVQ